jgi:hypothetical protein
MVTDGGGDGRGKRGSTDYTTVWITEEGREISEKDRLAAEVEDRWVDFQDGLSNKRRYPVEQFRAFWDAGKRYAELTKNDPLIHRKVVAAINGLREFLEVERKRIPGTIIADADRLESLLFSGYDPYFEGDEPPGL